MPLTKDFNETIKEQLQKSEEFRRALLREAVGCMISGDVETGNRYSANTLTARLDSLSSGPTLTARQRF